MSIVQTVSDVQNAFLSRREITCDFAGLAGRLTKMDATDMISKEYGLAGKVVIPIGLRTHMGKPLITGTFYVYEDEVLAKRHVNPTIIARLEKAKAKRAEEAKAKADAAAAESADVKDDGEKEEAGSQ